MTHLECEAVMQVVGSSEPKSALSDIAHRYKQSFRDDRFDRHRIRGMRLFPVERENNKESICSWWLVVSG